MIFSMENQYIYLWAQWGILNYDRYRIILRQFGNLEVAWKKIDIPFLIKIGFGQEKAIRVLEARKKINIDYLRNKMERAKAKIFSIDDKEYPSNLRSIPSPPVFLFVRGKLPLFHKSIGVVGTRNITDYGRMATEKMVTNLVENGFVINSGLAIGIDSYAHEITLKCGGVTVAVLGSGVNYIYPRSNCNLAEHILRSGGAVVSEYPFDMPAAKHHFPLRNRIISGLSRGVLIVEGGIKSGALITARYALEQGRDVFAIPNNINCVNSGTNHLVRRGEAKLVESASHILEEYEMQPAKAQQTFIFSEIESVLLEKIAKGGKTIDELTLETSYNVARLSEILINLQLKNVVREINRKWVII